MPWCVESELLFSSIAPRMKRSSDFPMSGLLARLPDRSGLERLWRLLPEARLVGGSVRDLLLDMPIQDLDLATPEPPDEVIRRLMVARISVFPTGLAHGTVTAVIEQVPYEITTLRRDDETDGRHAVVSWTRDWREDAARRDFTINAMSLGCDDVLHDYFEGQRDLARHHVRFVGDAHARVREDALRALRFFRFEARYGRGDPDLEACRAIAEQLDLVSSLSSERITSEVLRILAGPRAEEAVTNMMRVGLLGEVLPEAHLGAFERLVATGAPADPLLRLFSLCTESLDTVSSRLKLSNAQVRTLKTWAAPEPRLMPASEDDDLRRALAELEHAPLIARSWLEQARDVAAPDAGWDSLRARLSAMPIPLFPLTGRDAAQCGIASGPAVGAWLRRGRDWWMAQGCIASHGACLAYLETLG